jgi:hypothetical protein
LAVVNEDESCCEVGTVAAMMTTRHRVRLPSFEPTGAIVLECIPLEKGRVKSVCVVYEFLKVLQGIEGNLECEERAPQALEKVI